MSSGLTPGGRDNSAPTRADRGFTMVEALIVVAIIMVMAAAAFPLVQSTLAYFELQGAVQSVSGSIQSTRYRAIADGYPYRIAFSKTNKTFQLASCPEWVPTNPGNCTFANVGSSVPYTGAGSKVQMSADFALSFFPSGSVAFTAGSNPITLSSTYGTGTTISPKSMTVSNYGSVKVQ